jgi:ATP-dependent exoDNAse (exonuclease V) beta subunit
VYKLAVGGWEKVVFAWKKNPLIRYADEVQSRQDHYLLMWKNISEEACTIGTAEHKKRELELCKTDYYEHDNIAYQTPTLHSQKDILQIQDFTSNRIYTELLVYNDEYMVAGQVDLVRKMGKRIWVRDYKTSKEITKEAFRKEKLLNPLSKLLNANWYIYALQVSTYAWMFEQCGYIVDGLDVLHTRSKEVYDMPYLRNEVQMMMDDYVTF